MPVHHVHDKFFKAVFSQLTSQHPALSRYVPTFDYVLIDLSLLPDEKIAAFTNQFLRLSTALMKYESRRKWYDALIKKQIAGWLSLMTAEEKSQLTEPLARYILEISGLSASEIIAILTPVSPQSKSGIMTAAEQIRYTTAEQVRRETTEALAKKMFAGGLAVEQIGNFLALPTVEVLQIVRVGLSDS